MAAISNWLDASLISDMVHCCNFFAYRCIGNPPNNIIRGGRIAFIKEFIFDFYFRCFLPKPLATNIIFYLQ
jgi:hypothetical protein